MSAKIAVSSSTTWLIGCTRPASAGASRTGSVTSTVSVASRASSAAPLKLSLRALSAALTRSFSPLIAGPCALRSSGVMPPSVFSSAVTEPLLPSARTRTASSAASSAAAAMAPEISVSRVAISVIQTSQWRPVLAVRRPSGQASVWPLIRTGRDSGTIGMRKSGRVDATRLIDALSHGFGRFGHAPAWLPPALRAKDCPVPDSASKTARKRSARRPPASGRWRSWSLRLWRRRRHRARRSGPRECEPRIPRQAPQGGKARLRPRAGRCDRKYARAERHHVPLVRGVLPGAKHGGSRREAAPP